MEKNLHFPAVHRKNRKTCTFTNIKFIKFQNSHWTSMPNPNYKPVGCLMYISAQPWHQQAHKCCSTRLFSLGAVLLLPTLLPNTNLSTGDDSLSPASPILLLDQATPSPKIRHNKCKVSTQLIICLIPYSELKSDSFPSNKTINK